MCKDNQDRLSALVSFYRICYRIIGFAIAVIGVALIPFLPKLVNLDVDVPYNITVIYLLFLANTVVTYLFFSYPRTVLTAHQQESVVNKVDSLFVIISVAAEILSLIITKNYEQVAQTISDKLERGATYLHGEGTYSRNQTKVVLTAVKKQQVAELKELVVDVDPDAFIIVQEAHQVLGDGFIRYSKDSL